MSISNLQSSISLTLNHDSLPETELFSPGFKDDKGFDVIIRQDGLWNDDSTRGPIATIAIHREMLPEVIDFLLHAAKKLGVEL